MNLNEYVAEVHKANQKWWKCLKCVDHPGFIHVWGSRVHGSDTAILVSVPCPHCEDGRLTRNIGELLMLSVSELAEALEGDRKHLMDDKLPHRSMFEVELADCVIRIMDVCGALGLDLEGAYREKMAFNAVREDHKLEHRMTENGKKY